MVADGYRCGKVVMPAPAGRSGARSRAACTALLGDLVGVSVRMVDAILGLDGLAGDWMGGSV